MGIHEIYSQDTIAAVASGHAAAAIAIIRLSGSGARNIIARIFSSTINPFDTPRRMTYGVIHDGDGAPIDDCQVVFYVAPASYTGEDMAEIFTHGSPVVAHSVLERCLAAGARLARPGEFSLRAFLNEKMDLLQAEAVNALTRARTAAAAQSAARQLEGALSKRIASVRSELLGALAHLEALIDHPDEDIAPQSGGELRASIERTSGEIAGILNDAHNSRIIERGITCAIIGKPNAGKSTLLNALVKFQRVITSPYAGTTRDSVEATAELDGIPVTYIDTAGIMDAPAQSVDGEAVERAREWLERAEMVIAVFDGSASWSGEDARIKEYLSKRASPTVYAINKSDLKSALNADLSGALRISAATGAGIDALREALAAAARGIAGESHSYLISERVESALMRAVESLRHAVESCAENKCELTAFDIREALAQLADIVGETTTDDALDVIFSQFCIGK